MSGNGDEKDSVPMDTGLDDTPVADDGLTKAQRKKLRQKARKKAEKEAAAAQGGASADANGDGADAGADDAGADDDGEKKSKKKKNRKKNKGPGMNSKTVLDMFPDEKFPVGVESDYELDLKLRLHGRTEAELAYADKLLVEDEVEDLRRAAEAHRQVRQYLKENNIIRPGMRLYDIATKLEAASRHFSRGNSTDPLSHGVAFPTGLSLNHIAAHDTALGPDDTRTLKESDILKVDFGVHVNGRIIDSAWTVTFDDKYDALVDAVREATYAGIAAAGVDVHLYDIGDAVSEVLDASEVSIDGRDPEPVKAIRNLNGHSIEPYQIHAGKSVPIVRSSVGTDQRASDGDHNRMKEGEQYAIEIFGTAHGNGYCHEEGETTHYMLKFDTPHVPLRLKSAKQVLALIKKEFGTLAFSTRDLQAKAGDLKVMGAIRCLADAGILDGYPPLVDAKGSFTAQFEHTLILRPTCKEVLSKGDDY